MPTDDHLFLSEAANAFLAELVQELWQGNPYALVSQIKARLRAKYGEAVEKEVRDYCALDRNAP